MFLWVALKEKCKISKDIVDNCRDLFESRMSVGRAEILLSSENPKQTFHLGLIIWKAMQRNVWKDIANLQTNQLNNCKKSQLHVLTTINSKEKK